MTSLQSNQYIYISIKTNSSGFLQNSMALEMSLQENSLSLNRMSPMFISPGKGIPFRLINVTGQNPYITYELRQIQPRACNNSLCYLDELCQRYC
jgi:hypothetical protein